MRTKHHARFDRPSALLELSPATPNSLLPPSPLISPSLSNHTNPNRVSACAHYGMWDPGEDTLLFYRNNL